MSDDRAPENIMTLLRAAGLTVSDEEARQLAFFHWRFDADRDRLRQIDLGETEPAITFVPGIEQSAS